MTYRISTSTADPSTNAIGSQVDSAEASDRTTANKTARSFLKQGYWVEVSDAESGELLAGPFDPDRPSPAYIV